MTSLGGGSSSTQTNSILAFGVSWIERGDRPIVLTPLDCIVRLCPELDCLAGGGDEEEEAYDKGE